ncbi:dihydrofolate reductase family protein [Nocardiopsis coralliicola]
MSMIFSHMTMSLDGYIAQTDDRVGELFEWYHAGDTAVPTPNTDLSFTVDSAGAQAWRRLTENTGALIAGRRLFDIAGGWNDQHPAGAPVVVVTRRPPEDAAEKWPRTVFAGSIEEAVSAATEIAGAKDTVIASASVTQQALALGLVDQVCVSLAPVLFGDGIPYFAALKGGHVLLEDPVVIPGRRALHLMYPVRR